MKNKIVFTSLFMLAIFILSSCAKGNGTSHPKRRGIRTEMGNM